MASVPASSTSSSSCDHALSQSSTLSRDNGAAANSSKYGEMSDQAAPANAAGESGSESVSTTKELQNWERKGDSGACGRPAGYSPGRQRTRRQAAGPGILGSAEASHPSPAPPRTR